MPDQPGPPVPAPTLRGHLPRKLDSAVTGLGNQEPAGSCSSPAISQRCLAVCRLSIVSTPGTKVAPRAAIPGPPQLAQWGHLAPLVSFRVVRDTGGGGRSCGHSMALPRTSHLVQDLDVTCAGHAGLPFRARRKSVPLYLLFPEPSGHPSGHVLVDMVRGAGPRDGGVGVWRHRGSES